MTDAPKPEQKTDAPKPEQKIMYIDPVTGEEVSELPPEQFAVQNRLGHLFGPFADAEAARKFARATSQEGPPWTVVALSSGLMPKEPDPVVVEPPEPTVVHASGKAQPQVAEPAHPPPLAHPHQGATHGQTQR